MTAASVQVDKWHEGEKAMHRLTHREQQAAAMSAYIRPAMPLQHREFFATLPFFLLGSVSTAAGDDDSNRHVWASIVWGPPGFVSSVTDPTVLAFNAAQTLAQDPLRDNLRVQGAHIGGLGIDFMSRRRNRMNGRVASLARSATRPEDGMDALSFTLTVSQSYGNCPKYVQMRQCSGPPPSSASAPPAVPSEVRNALSPSDIELIRHSDTMFVATAIQHDRNPGAVGTDVSHRGGARGFVSVLDADRDGHTIEWPDYVGNFMFNTIGNLLQEPSCGLLFLDFDTGSVLQLSGRATVLQDAKTQPGAQRTIRFVVGSVRFTPRAVPLKWTYVEASPYNPPVLGDDASQAGPDSETVRICRIVQETPNVKSFWLTFKDPAARHKRLAVAGQYGTFLLTMPDLQPVVRTWTISSAFSEGGGDDPFSITVKRAPNGSASVWLHDYAKVGDTVVFKGFSGEFTLKDETLLAKPPLLFLAAGVGITPIASILRSLDRHAGQMGALPRVDLLYGARNEEDMVFRDEFAEMARRNSPHLQLWCYYSRGDQAASNGNHFVGHLDSHALSAFLHRMGAATADYLRTVHVFICGPEPFMAALEGYLLHDIGVSPAQVTMESFNY